MEDGDGNVRQLTDKNGKVTDSYFYDAHGNGLAGGSGSTPNSFGYRGQQRDSNGNYYLRARYYNPQTGRFLSQDPELGQKSRPESLHRYLYASNDPVNRFDPSGRSDTIMGRSGRCAGHRRSFGIWR